MRSKQQRHILYKIYAWIHILVTQKDVIFIVHSSMWDSLKNSKLFKGAKGKSRNALNIRLESLCTRSSHLDKFNSFVKAEMQQVYAFTAMFSEVCWSTSPLIKKTFQPIVFPKSATVSAIIWLLLFFLFFRLIVKLLWMQFIVILTFSVSSWMTSARGICFKEKGSLLSPIHTHTQPHTKVC